LAKEYEERLRTLLELYLLPGLRKHVKEIVVSVDLALIMSFLSLMDIRIRPLTYADGKTPPAPQFLKLIKCNIACFAKLYLFKENFLSLSLPNSSCRILATDF
jgi:hypothetical protein